ncbi:hypothetical protein AVEN_93642-1 [Araneus ventricosus]|uniref:DDE-1 domain-containing protein n=1 Tax=Araneus ventricosus TaxID=182803 RepID=A0A4Y2UZK1_ARAVE|nr:hypothetical protein AVEN_93642-1 [Araneus ventricosus]
MLLLGVIEAMKKHYKKKLITHTLKKINVKDVIYMIAQAWQLVKAATIRKSFHKIIVEKRRENESQQTENFLRLSMALKGVKKFWKRTFSSGWTLKTNIQVLKSLMMKKLYNPLISHRTFMMLTMRTRTLRI